MSVRLSAVLLGRLDALAAARKLTRSELLRALVTDAAVLPAEAVPGERELLAITSERARSGNMSAVKLLLEREARRDPADVAFEREFGGRLDVD